MLSLLYHSKILLSGNLGHSAPYSTSYIIYNLFQIDYIDLILANLEYNFGSIGGFCVGDRYVVDRQMLTSSGYVFTTSQPAMLTAATLKALEMLENNPTVINQLQKKCLLVHKSLSKLKVIKIVQLSSYIFKSL